MSEARAAATARALFSSTANARGYSCGAFSSLLLQAFCMSAFDSLGLLACCAAMQSFICCLCDLLWVLLVLLPEDDVDDDGVLVLGYVERSEGGEGGGLVCATTIPAAISAATAKDAATRFIGSSSRLRDGRAWTRAPAERI
jgi:hypothetical protein